MRKLFLLTVSGAVAFSANAQYAKQAHSVGISRTSQPAVATRVKSVRPPVTARTTAPAFYTETFGSGSASSLPSGWSAESMPSAGSSTWKWANTASTSAFTMGAMASTTASDGWMIFDSDGIGAACGTCEPSGYLQSPSINCATHTTVRLNFENYFRKFNDSCSVWVSTSPTFSTYQVFPVTFNNSLATNISTANPSVVHINISSAAAGQPNVYIRFVYYGFAGGSYSWMIDNMTLSELDPVDLSLNSAAMLSFGGSSVGWGSFGSKPLKMMDTVFPFVFASNLGATAALGTSVNAKIFRGTTNVYDYDAIVDLPVNAEDSIANYPGVASYYPTTVGDYVTAFDVTASGDADLTNNRDSVRFSATDTTWSMNLPGSMPISSIYVHRPASGSTLRMSWSPATQFAVTADRTGDTVSSVSVSFANTTAAGQRVGVQIYHFEPAGTGGVWVYDGATKFRDLTAAEISTTTAIRYATFPVDAALGNIILEGTTNGRNYAAVVKGEGNTGIVLVNTTTNPAPLGIIGYTGSQDTSDNDGASGQQFGQSGLPYALESTPMINLNFGKVPVFNSVINVNNAIGFVGKAFPNPANNVVSVPFTLNRNADATVTLTNAMGQVVRTQTVSAVNGQETTATFMTADLAAGVYIYTIEANGQRATGRVSVAH